MAKVLGERVMQFRWFGVFYVLLAFVSGTLRITGRGYQIRIPKMLKKRWQRAIWIAFFFSVTREARNAVQVVPMFAPRVKGSICSRVMICSATSGVRVGVVMELDWTMIVITMPKRIRTA